MLAKELKIKIDRQLKEYSQELNIPGMAVLASKDGQLIYEYYHGYRDVKNKLAVTGETIFGLASITKSFVALAIMQLQERKKLSVEDPVKKWIKNFNLLDTSTTDEIKIHHLMTHTAGLPGLPLVHQARLESILKDPDGRKLFGNEDIFARKQIHTVEELVEELRKEDFSLLGRPGEVFNYSNESYALLQKIIEEASGMAFLDYMEQNILQALEMNRASFLREEIAGWENLTELYAYDPEKDREYFHSPSWWDVGDIYSNGSLKASARDLLNYANMYYQEGEFKGRQILSPDSIEVMTKAQVRTPNEAAYAYGLTTGNVYGERYFGHGGGIKGVSSYFLVLPEKRMAVLVLINIAEAPAEAMALISLRNLLGKSEEEVDFPKLDPTPKELGKYVGSYASLEGQKIQVEIEKKQLLLIIGKQRILLDFIGKNKFLTSDGKIVAFIENDEGILGIFRGLRYLEKQD